MNPDVERPSGDLYVNTKRITSGNGAIGSELSTEHVSFVKYANGDENFVFDLTEAIIRDDDDEAARIILRRLRVAFNSIKTADRRKTVKAALQRLIEKDPFLSDHREFPSLSEEGTVEGKPVFPASKLFTEMGMEVGEVASSFRIKRVIFKRNRSIHGPR